MEVEVVTPIVAEAEVQKYTLVSDDIYVRRYTSTTVPDWYRNLIENLVAQDPTITDIQGAIDYLTSVDNGYATQLFNLENQQSSTNALLTTLQSSNSNHTALIADLQVTKVDEASAQAIATNAVQSYIAGGSANAWFTSQVSTYASEIEANASSISTLSATLDGHTVSIDTIDSIAVEAHTWSANASKLITNPSGQITGWSFGDGTNTKSFFDIYADNFRIVNSTYNFVPFSISGSSIVFNGVVDFTNTNTYGTTTIDGGKITTNTLQADRLKAGINNSTVWTGGGLISSDFNGNAYGDIGAPTTGFRLSSNSAGTSTDPSIYGAYIKGGTIDGGIVMLPSVVSGNFGKETYFLSCYSNYTIPANASSYTAYSPIMTIHSPAYGSGLMNTRIINLSTSKILISTNNPIVFPFGVGTYHAIEVSVDGGAYYQIDGMSNVYGSSKVYQGLCPSFSSTIDIRIKAVYTAASPQVNSISCAVSATCTILN